MAAARQQIRQQARPDSRQRLSRISHHFLSESRRQSEQAPYILLAMMEYPGQQAFPLTGMARILEEHGLKTMMVERDSGGNGATSGFRYTFHRHIQNGLSETPVFTSPINDHAPPWQQTPDIVLMPIYRPEPDFLGQAQRILLPVPASRDGLRTAYMQIKKMSLQIRPRSIGIVITDAKNSEQARQSFSRLAVAALSFLGIKLLSYGYLQDEEAQQAAGTYCRSCLHDICDLVLVDREHWRKQCLAQALAAAGNTTAGQGGDRMQDQITGKTRRHA